MMLTNYRAKLTNFSCDVNNFSCNVNLFRKQGYKLYRLLCKCFRKKNL